MKVIIIGGVAAGASAAARLRRLDETTEIILVERGKEISYANCGLPYHLGRVIKERDSLLVMPAEDFRERYNVDVRTQCEAKSIDRNKKEVVLRDLISGQEIIESYDKLIIATGVSPRASTVEGRENPGVFNLWTLDDMDKLDEFLKEGHKALVVGGGFVGVELAENLHERGLQVTLLTRGNRLLPTLDYEMSAYLIAELRKQEIVVKTEMQVERIFSEEERLGVVLKNEEQMIFDLVVFCIGVRPNSNLARGAGLELAKSGHIITDRHMCTSDPDIYAAGDVAEVADPIFGGKTAIALAGPANRQGRLAANNIMEREDKYHGTFGANIIKVGGLNAGSVGYTETQLKSAGILYRKIYLHSPSNASYYPGGSLLHMKFLFGECGRVYGFQAIGAKGVSKRIDVIATAMRNKMNMQELADLELSYAPPFNSAKDPINMAGMIAENFFDGLTDLAHFDNLPDKAFILDVREASEFKYGSLPDAVNIPLGELRGRIDKVPRDQEVCVLCRSGFRGYLAERILKQHGYKVANLSGGYLSWRAFQGAEELNRVETEIQQHIFEFAGKTAEREEEIIENEVEIPKGFWARLFGK